MLLSPFEALDARTIQEQQWDDEVRQRRAAAQPTGIYNDPAARAAQQFNDMREDAATGPLGYNRQWVPLLQSLKGKRLAGPRGTDIAPGLPTETYADPDHTGHMTLVPNPSNPATPTVTMPTVTMPKVVMPQAQPTSVGVLKHKAAKTDDPDGMPEDQDAFLARLYANNPPDWYKPTPAPTPAAPPPAATPTPTRKTTLPSTPQPTLGSVAALNRKIALGL